MREIYDIEIYPNFFCIVFKNIDTQKFTIFEISNRKNELNILISFLKQKGLQLMGFNNINFDYPLLHNSILTKNLNNLSTQNIITNIYNKANDIINSEYSSIPYWKVLIPQYDLYKIHHFDNKAKITSLKALEIAMRMENVQDLPFKPGSNIPEIAFDDVINYCINDVNATYEFYLKSINEIKLRCDLSNEYNLHLYNCSEPKMGEELFLNELSKEMNIDKYELKKLRSPINKLVFKNYILNYISFKTESLQKLHQILLNYETTDTKNGFSYTTNIGDFNIDYGQGGLHGSIKAGIYKEDDDIGILDIDVASFYPNLAIINNFRPKHLGEAFSKIYKSIYELRKTFPKTDSRNYGCKIILNGSFGKMNEENSFLYDPESLLKITLNGQLLLSMLMEDIYLKYKVRFLQGNTDGFTFMYNRNDLNGIKELVKNWESMTGLSMEYAEYKQMIIRDVNNYIATYTNNKSKYKGCFELEPAWHKDHSMLIVAQALSKYFIDNIPVRTTIESCTNIFDFCKRARIKGEGKLVARDNLNNDTELQKNNRYYVSKTGISLIKILPPLFNDDGTFKIDKLNNYKKKNPRQVNMFDFVEDVLQSKDRDSNLEVGYKCTILNKMEDIEHHLYNINYEYYINECYKIINVVNNKL